MECKTDRRFEKMENLLSSTVQVNRGEKFLVDEDENFMK